MTDALLIAFAKRVLAQGYSCNCQQGTPHNPVFCKDPVLRLYMPRKAPLAPES